MTDYIAKTFQGLEEVLAEELNQFGATDVEIKKRAVFFKADKELMYKLNLGLRTALCILQPIATFTAKDENELYKQSKDFDWGSLMTHRNTFAIEPTIYSNDFKHSQFASLRVKDAAADFFREKCGYRPSVDKDNPDIKIQLHISHNSCTLLIDTSGDSLYKRGYRSKTTTAPLSEVLAAGMILLSKWDKNSTFVDPMCGSGTIPIEAAMIALDIPPCLKRRHFGFMNFKDYDAELWNKIKNEAIDKSRQRKKIPEIWASDIDANVLKIAEENIRLSPVPDFKIKVVQAPFSTFSLPHLTGFVITNPPYGERMKTNDIFKFYSEMGNRMKRYYQGYEFWIISSNVDALKSIGLHHSQKILLFNGPLQTSFQQYLIYEGSKKSITPTNELE